MTRLVQKEIEIDSFIYSQMRLFAMNLEVISPAHTACKPPPHPLRNPYYYLCMTVRNTHYTLQFSLLHVYKQYRKNEITSQHFRISLSQPKNVPQIMSHECDRWLKA